MINVYELQDSNKRRSSLIIGLFVLFVFFLSWFFVQALGYGSEIMLLALFLAVVMSFTGFWWGDKMILAISQARPANRQKDFLFFTVGENLAMTMQIPTPKLYVIDDNAPNAFATGRDPQHAVICATSGLLNKLNRSELEGVIAHELSHIKNFDTRLMCLVAVLLGTVTLLGDWFLRGSRFGNRDRDNQGNLGAILFMVGIILALLSPLVAQLIQLALSRRREFFADSSAALLTRNPAVLAAALEKLAQDKEPLEAANKATAHLYIVNPLKNRHDGIGWFASLFNTHPPIEQRIKILKEML